MHMQNFSLRRNVAQATVVTEIVYCINHTAYTLYYIDINDLSMHCALSR